MALSSGGPVSTSIQTKKRGSPYGVSIYEFEVYANSTLPAQLPNHSGLTPVSTVKIDGFWNPVESFFIGQYEYSPFAFHNLFAGIVYDSIVYPGKGWPAWTSKWNISRLLSGSPVDGLTGVRVGPASANATILPVRTNTDLYTTWNYTLGSNNNGTYNVTYDIWLYANETAARSGEGAQIELMIMPHTSGAYDMHGYAAGNQTGTGFVFQQQVSLLSYFFALSCHFSIVDSCDAVP